MDTIKKALEDNGYDYAVAVATQAEINAGAACGQLAIVCENPDNLVKLQVNSMLRRKSYMSKSEKK